MISLRRTAFIWLSLLLLFSGIVTTVASYIQVTRESDELLDNQLRQLAHYIGEALPTDLQPVPYNPSFEAEENFVVELWMAGETQARSSNPTAAVPRQAQNGFNNVRTANHAWRTFTDIDARRTVQVSQRLDVRQELSADAALRAAIPIAILIPLSWLLLGLVIDRLSRRLDKLAASVAERQVTSREPIAVEDVPRELAPFIRAINDLLFRLQASMERQRRFVSDAAHELRTPLAALKLQVSNVRSIATTRAIKERLDEVDQGVSRASALVQQLLKLARYDAEATPAPPEPTEVTLLVRECIAAIAPLARSRSTELELQAAELPSVETSPGELKVLISNLVDNAVRHSPEGGKVEVEVKAAENDIVVTIQDEGPGIPGPLLERVFERFYRVAGQEVEGSGLGLAIARSIAERHRLYLTLHNRADRTGLIAELRLPGPFGQPEAPLTHP
ncbi:ATP-binding protein [Labrys okinawensis]|uniref:ATP-binding protein n=1 Tax=Labrys okinawensis TaxID=346911 RepID=UPI0039BCE15D